MNIIEIRPSKKLRGLWISFEQSGVEPAHRNRQNAIDYARNRFGGCPDSEIHVYDHAGVHIVEKVSIDGGIYYGLAH